MFVADTTVNEKPNAIELADIVEQSAEAARNFGHEPRVALLSFSNFGDPMLKSTEPIREAVEILKARNVDFEFEGEMSVDVALDHELMKERYPFSALTGPANVLVMPDLHSANISYKLLAAMGGGKVIGPLLFGMEKPIQVARMIASTSDILNMAGIAGFTSIREGKLL